MSTYKRRKKRMPNKKGEAMLIELSGQMLERFDVIKKHYGETDSTEVVRRLICESYDKLYGHAKKTHLVTFIRFCGHESESN